MKETLQTHIQALFCQKQEALLHGDLHLGSLMVTPESTYVIDAEFAFAGPIAFDVAKFVFDLLLSFFALEGHPGKQRDGQRSWLLQALTDTWNEFVKEFGTLWNDAVAAGQGELSVAALYGPGAVNGTAALQAGPWGGLALIVCIHVRFVAQELKDAYFSSLWRDVVAFGGLFMIRRLVGIAHVLEMESIEVCGGSREHHHQICTRCTTRMLMCVLLVSARRCSLAGRCWCTRSGTRPQLMLCVLLLLFEKRELSSYHPHWTHL